MGDEVIEESIAFEVPQKKEDKPEEEDITLPLQPKEPETEKTDTVLNIQEEIKLSLQPKEPESVKTDTDTVLNVQEEIIISTDEVIEESIAFEVPQKKEDKPEEEDITLPFQPKEPETEKTDA